MEGEWGNGRSGDGCQAVDLSALPEGCIANILSLTSPRDACRLSLLCSTFLSAARSDAVWDRFLPSDCAALISPSPSSSSSFASASSKRDLYFRLCDSPILIDEGKKSFSLERESGKKCYMLAPRDLYIVWGDTPRYWMWVSTPNFRFPEVAELVDVCWLEIRGKINTRMLSPNTNYVACLVFKWTTEASGFGIHPVDLSIGVAGGETNVRSVDFKPERANRLPYRFGRRFRFLGPGITTGTDDVVWSRRGDGWCEVELGKFFYRGGDEDGELLEMGVEEVKAGNWKRGLVVGGFEIRPKSGK